MSEDCSKNDFVLILLLSLIIFNYSPSEIYTCINGENVFSDIAKIQTKICIEFHVCKMYTPLVQQLVDKNIRVFLMNTNKRFKIITLRLHVFPFWFLNRLEIFWFPKLHY